MNYLVGHFLLFMAIAVVFLMLPLLLGKLLRPRLPTPEKDAVYECGEPTIGSSYIQFDLRFYVVALLFIIFDVEVAFFFPWATVFGPATQLADTSLNETARTGLSEALAGESGAAAGAIPAEAANTLAGVAMVDILVFFGVLLVGFAYVWKRGDLDWVRAVTQKARRPIVAPPAEPVRSVERPLEPVGT
jgi:NADH-quinone oxidoreductase subunit A